MLEIQTNEMKEWLEAFEVEYQFSVDEKNLDEGEILFVVDGDQFDLTEKAIPCKNQKLKSEELD